NEEVLQYIPQRVKPQIQILNERANSKEIILDEKWIASRKKVLKEQIESVLNYLKTGICRQSYILKYFGELETKVCEICDNCLKNKKSSIDPVMRNAWRLEILELLSKEPKIYLRKVYQYFPSNKAHWVDVILQELIGEKKISRENDLLCLYQDD
ncbi:MAG: RecQ family zinc-binding domain-containing protein, partial [Saprospiraceae bacterium]